MTPRSPSTLRLATEPRSTEEPENDASWTFVPPGEYEVAFVSEERARVWNRQVWFVKMRIVTLGEHLGSLLLYPLNALPKGKRPTTGHYICSAFLIATERRPPKNLWRLRPSSFLSECVFSARIRTIEKDSKGVVLPPAGHHSRVDCLLKRLSGLPPHLRKERA